MTWSLTATDLEGRATNEGTEPMEDVAVISQSGGVMVGTLAPGESKSFRMPLRNLNGSLGLAAGVRPLRTSTPARPPSARSPSAAR